MEEVDGEAFCGHGNGAVDGIDADAVEGCLFLVHLEDQLVALGLAVPVDINDTLGALENFSDLFGQSKALSVVSAINLGDQGL